MSEPLRVHYRERQPLGRADLEDQQAHQRDRRERHEAEHHQWGVRSGLAVRETPGVQLVVGRGAGVDSRGRSLRVLVELVIDEARLVAAFAALGGPASALLSLRHVLLPAAAGGAAVAPPSHARRWLEDAVPVLAIVTHDGPAGAASAVADLADVPDGATFDERSPGWVLPIAEILETPDGQTGSRIVEDSDRAPVWAGLVGESVLSPGSGAWLRVGLDSAAEPGLAIGRVGTTDTDADLTSNATGRTRFARGLRVRGDGVRRSLRLRGPRGATERPGAIQILPLPAPPEAQFPAKRAWSISRTRPTPAEPRRRLRIEADNPGKEGNPASYQLAVGFPVLVDTGNEPVPDLFDSVLTVGMDGTVRVREVAYVGGTIREGPIQPTLDDPRFHRKAVELSLLGALRVNFADGPKVDPNTGTDVIYTVEVENVGEVDLNSIQVLQSVVDWRAPEGVPVESLQYPVGFLTQLVAPRPGSGGPSQLDATFPVANAAPAWNLAPPEEYGVGVLAFGLTPVGSIVFAFFSQAIAP